MPPPRPRAGTREAEARLAGLARSDKWYLSAGDGYLWAPEFPAWLDRPGYWDEAHAHHLPVGPLFTVALVDGDGHADPFRVEGMDWRPDRLRVHWRTLSGLSFTELRYVLPGGRFCSAWRTQEELGWPNPVFADRALVAFTAAAQSNILAAENKGPEIRYRTRLVDHEQQASEASLALSVATILPRGHHPVAPKFASGIDAALEGVFTGLVPAEGPTGPDWHRTPFQDSWGAAKAGALTLGDFVPAPGTRFLHMAVAVPLAPLPARVGLVFQSRVEDVGGCGSPPVGTDPPAPRFSASNWADALGQYPRLECSDAFLERYADHRLYGLHLNRIAGGGERIPHPAIADGIRHFHRPAALSAPCHMMEARWCADPSMARGSLLNFLNAQRDDGSLPRRLCVVEADSAVTTHVDWGGAVLALDALHPDEDFLRTAYAGLSRYAEWLIRSCDPEGSGLVTVAEPGECGQGHTPRFAYPASREAWAGGGRRPRRLKAVDASVFAYRLFHALGEMASRWSQADAEKRWRAAASRTGSAISERMWSPGLFLYTDLDAETGARVEIATAAGFYPLLTDLPDDERLPHLLDHLEDPETFGTPYPVPSVSVSDSTFNADGLWNGERVLLPWNGRVWPIINSHVLEGLMGQWRSGREAVGPIAARLLTRWVRMLFHRGELGRPNAYEHYNPLSGRPSVSRGIDDMTRSWIFDLVVRGVAGVDPTAAALGIHPLPLGLDRAGFRAHLRDCEVRVDLRGDRVTAVVDGVEHETEVGRRLEIPWEV